MTIWGLAWLKAPIWAWDMPIHLMFTLARRYVRVELGTVCEVLFIAKKNWFSLTLKPI
jgi:hypothetical protein